MSTVIACSISILALFGWSIEEPENPANHFGYEAIAGALEPAAPLPEPAEAEGWLGSFVAKVIEAGERMASL